jgi:hypothetical protein
MQNHKYRKIDNRRGERSETTEKTSDSDRSQGGVGVAFVRVETAERYHEEEGQVELEDN